MTVTVSVKGQMVLPSEIRKRYHIKPRMKVELIDKGNEIVVVPLPDNPIAGSRGILKGMGTKDMLKFRREERRREEKKYLKRYGIPS